jgi:sarcosine oxidase subunit gamma|tara:strand:+ start:3547 stop:4296 length:750 start_codon:yes stop_codon:yes gene_type:complete
MTDYNPLLPIAPAQGNRRSPLYRRHVDLQAKFEQVGDAVLVSHYVKPGIEVLLAANLGLVDLSTMPRTGFKGAGAPAWAASQRVKLPKLPNTAVTQKDGSVVAKLSHQELLIVSNIMGSATSIDRLNREHLNREHLSKQTLAPQTYSLPRADSHSWLAVTGNAAAEMFSKICGVDLRVHKFAHNQVAQTSVAKINGVILRHDLATTPCFYILSDITSTEFLWDSLLDAMEEYRGAAVGVAAMRSLAANK